jgi:uncharacterized integral membrane protein
MVLICCVCDLPGACLRITETGMRVSTLLVMAPVAAVAAALAVANREPVAFQFDPFASGAALVMPLFLLVFLSFLLGVLVGGATMALRKGRMARRRRAAAGDIATAMALEATKSPINPPAPSP